VGSEGVEGVSGVVGGVLTSATLTAASISPGPLDVGAVYDLLGSKVTVKVCPASSKLWLSCDVNWWVRLTSVRLEVPLNTPLKVTGLVVPGSLVGKKLSVML